MEPKITVDLSSFNRALSEYIRHNKRDIADICNMKAYIIAKNAIEKTKAANPSNIKSQMEARSNMGQLSIAEAMAMKRLRKQSNYKPRMPALRREARKILSAKLKSVGFLRSGWVPAIRMLSFRLKKQLVRNLTKVQKGKDKGGCKPAMVGGFAVSATIWNSITSGGGRTAATIIAGLQRAINAEVISMRQYIDKKLTKSTNKFNQ